MDLNIALASLLSTVAYLRLKVGRLCRTGVPIAEVVSLTEPYADLIIDVHDLIIQHKTGFGAIQAYADDPSMTKCNYIDTFLRAKCVIKHHPILNDEGEVKPLNADQAPNDMHEFIGYRLPDELYYYLMRGLVGPQVITESVDWLIDWLITFQY